MKSVRPTAEGVTEVAVAGKPKMAKGPAVQSPAVRGSASLPPMGESLLDPSAGKARLPEYVSRADVRTIAHEEISQALRDYRPIVISQVAPVVK